MTLLRTVGLSRAFGGIKAVDGVDFALKAGEIRALIGPNGAGKTTFVSLVAGRLAPTAGRIFFQGDDITELPAFRRVRLGIAYTFQVTSIYGRLTVAQNVRLAAEGGRGGHGAAQALKRVGLAERAGQLAGTLSYGHQRLVEIAMGLALHPSLLILDEPTQGLSDGEIAAFITLVKAIARDATVLLIEHNMPVVMALADRITVLDNGTVLAEGTPAEIRGSAAVQRAYLGTS